MSAPPIDEIVKEYATFVGRALRYLGVREQELDDLCQEVFVVVHRKLDSFEGRSALRTWLYGICVRAALEYKRKRARSREVPLGDAGGESAPVGAEDPSSRSDDRRTLLALLETLDDDKRAVVVLYEIEGLTMAEVAEVIGCPLQTAYSRLHTARAELSKLAHRLTKRDA